MELEGQTDIQFLARVILTLLGVRPNSEVGERLRQIGGYSITSSFKDTLAQASDSALQDLPKKLKDMVESCGGEYIGFRQEGTHGGTLSLMYGGKYFTPSAWVDTSVRDPVEVCDSLFGLFSMRTRAAIAADSELQNWVALADELQAELKAKDAELEAKEAEFEELLKQLNWDESDATGTPRDTQKYKLDLRDPKDLHCRSGLLGHHCEVTIKALYPIGPPADVTKMEGRDA